MRKLIFDGGERVISFVNARIGGQEDFPRDAYSIGIEEDGELIGGVVFTHPDLMGMVLHSGGKNARWLNRTSLRAIFSYPFKQCGCRRLTTLVRSDNPHADVVARKAGFKYEGRLRAAEADGADLLVYGMLADECRWLEK